MSLSRNDKISLSTTEIAKLVRKQLKAEFKDCKFSVRTKYYSMGSSLTVSLMRADKKIKKDFTEISESSLSFHRDNHYTPEQLKKLQEKTYHQLNEYVLRREYDANGWCNGLFLTERGHNFLKRVVEIADHYNFDDSDSMTDYYHVNFSFSLALGKWDKPFVDGVAPPKRPKAPRIPRGATHVIGGSGLREITEEEKELDTPKGELEARWFEKTDWSKVVLEL